MKQLSCNALLFFAALVFLTSCGGGNTKEPTNTATVDTSHATAPMVNTIITTPENMVLIVHKVANYAKWKMAYDADDSARLANGLHNYVLGRGLMDTNIVMVALKADDIAKAKAFASNPGLKKAMQQGGVIGTPSIHYSITTWQDTVHIETRMRSRTTFMVKDWDVWLKNFQEGKQERMDNGITDRVVGHDADDAKKVNLVTSISDTAKAFAYFKSDALKKRRESGGVIGEPERFLFTIVQRY